MGFKAISTKMTDLLSTDTPSTKLPTPQPPTTSTEVKGKQKERDPQLRYCEPYYHPYRTNVKQRWIGRGILEVISTEFRDRSVDYYVRCSFMFENYAVECLLNGGRDMRLPQESQK
jgi:hypothetical protein